MSNDMHPLSRDFFDRFADQLMIQLTTVAQITGLTKNTDVIGAYAEAIVADFSKQIVNPVNLSTGTIVSVTIPPAKTVQYDQIYWSPNPVPAICTKGDFAIVPHQSVIGTAEIKRTDYPEGLADIERKMACADKQMPPHAKVAFAGIVCIRKYNKQKGSNILERLLRTRRVFYLMSDEGNGGIKINYQGVYALINFLGHIRSLDHVKKSAFRVNYPGSEWPYKGESAQGQSITKR